MLTQCRPSLIWLQAAQALKLYLACPPSSAKAAPAGAGVLDEQALRGVHAAQAHAGLCPLRWSAARTLPDSRLVPDPGDRNLPAGQLGREQRNAWLHCHSCLTVGNVLKSQQLYSSYGRVLHIADQQAQCPAEGAKEPALSVAAERTAAARGYLGAEGERVAAVPCSGLCCTEGRARDAGLASCAAVPADGSCVRARLRTTRECLGLWLASWACRVTGSLAATPWWQILCTHRHRSTHATSA